MSKPVLGMFAGLAAGVLAGLAAIGYFEVTGWLDRWCVLACTVLFAQLLGATIASALGKPHRVEEATRRTPVTLRRRP